MDLLEGADNKEELASLSSSSTSNGLYLLVVPIEGNIGVGVAG